MGYMHWALLPWTMDVMLNHACTDTVQERSPSSDSRSLRRRNSGHGSGASNSVDMGRRHAASDDFGGG